MKTTYKGYEIHTNNYGGGDVKHTVTVDGLQHDFTTMMDAMQFVDILAKRSN